MSFTSFVSSLGYSLVPEAYTLFLSSGNFISDLMMDDFQGYESSLQTLVLAENSLTLLRDGIFRTLDNLRTLNLRGNNILMINSQAFQVGQQV